MSQSPPTPSREQIQALIDEMRDPMLRGGYGAIVWSNRVDEWADRLSSILAGSSPLSAPPARAGEDEKGQP